MKQWTRSQIMKGLQRMVSDITSMKKSEEFNGKKGGIWTCGDDDWIFQGLPPFDYWVEYGDFPRSWIGDKKHSELSIKTMYVNGIHREIYNWLEERGWHLKWHDPGTLFFWKDMSQSASEIVKYLVGDKQKGWVV